MVDLQFQVYDSLNFVCSKSFNSFYGLFFSKKLSPSEREEFEAIQASRKRKAPAAVKKTAASPQKAVKTEKPAPPPVKTEKKKKSGSSTIVSIRFILPRSLCDKAFLFIATSI